MSSFFINCQTSTHMIWACLSHKCISGHEPPGSLCSTDPESLPSLQQAKCTVASGPLHGLFLLPAMLLLCPAPILPWLSLSSYSDFNSQSPLGRSLPRPPEVMSCVLSHHVIPQFHRQQRKDLGSLGHVLLPSNFLCLSLPFGENSLPTGSFK